MSKANGIYERKGKGAEITYYIRYSYKYRDEDGNEKEKDIKKKVGRKSQGCNREIAKQALKARLGELTQARFNLDKVRKPHTFGELVDKYLKHAESYKASFSREKYSIKALRECFGSAFQLAQMTTWLVEKWKRERAKQVKPSPGRGVNASAERQPTTHSRTFAPRPALRISVFMTYGTPQPVIWL
jgi:hypothetical protein